MFVSFLSYVQGLPYTNVIDWWALATMVYEMISGLPPFWDDEQAEMLEKICYSCIDDVDWDDSIFTPQCKDFIRKVSLNTNDDS